MKSKEGMRGKTTNKKLERPSESKNKLTTFGSPVFGILLAMHF